MCLMQTDLPVPEGPRIIEILSSGMPRLSPRRILLRPNALCTSTNSTASGTPVGRCLPVCHWYSSSSPSAGRRTGSRVTAACAGASSRGRSGSLGSGSRGFGSGPPSRRISGGLRSSATRQPPIGALGFAPQKIWVPSMPIRCTSTMFSTIDFAVAVPTPTGPPDAL